MIKKGSEHLGDILMIIILSLLGILGYWMMGRLGIHLEKKSYNNGKCPYCNTKLIFKFYDSQSGRNYCCEKCKYVTRVSYDSVDKYSKNK